MTPIKPWYWRKLPLANRTGSQVFSKLFLCRNSSGKNAGNNYDNGFSNSSGIATLLESPSPSNFLARYSICAGSPRTEGDRQLLWTPGIGEILPFLRDRLQSQRAIAKSNQSDIPDRLPFTGGWLGWLGYDLAWEIERLPLLKPESLPFPVAYWYEPAEFAIIDSLEETLWLAASEEQTLDAMEQKLELQELDSEIQKPYVESIAEDIFNLAPNLAPNLGANNLEPRFYTSQADYEAAVVKVKKHIEAGDIFQANISLRFEVNTAAESWRIYRALQQINPSPFASYWQTPWGDTISCSPERLLRLQGRAAETRPIAGTRKRGASPEIDYSLEQELIANTKERAEHIMLVDLERNDLGRVCEWGSVRVNELLAIERYSHVMHLVSNVVGTLRPDCDAIDAIRAMFPGGTITGCPKVRCMEIIEELEPVRRNLFYGSCGYIDWRGNLDLNILIRTLLYLNDPSNPERSLVVGQVGSGIVADSIPEKEWEESLQKARAQIYATIACL
ncbi:MAG: anthranilate synthase component I [Oscillatoria sp. SIO1A7]|nr:anthranilate synthase component I [Oscillatoria sp. SIO1A7]